MKKLKRLFIPILAISFLGLTACDALANKIISALDDSSSSSSEVSSGSVESSAVIPGDNSSSGIPGDPNFSSNPGSDSSASGGNASSSSAISDSSTSNPVGPIAPTSLALDKYQLTLTIDQEFQITATVLPAEATYTLVWSSSNPDVATVDNGLVKAVSSGSADINVSVQGTNLTDKCVVNVASAFHDYVKDGSVKLNLDYTGRDFYEDGLEQVSLLTPIDGDTAHFKTKTVTLKARFYGIDTPESTGKVQPWGVPASNFTKEKLKAADKNGTIVVSSPQKEYGKPDPDSTGSRYVSLVWINETKKNASLDELYLLNLWIVQEGLSMKKNVSDISEYEAAFDGAEAQAKVYLKNMWSGERDPFFNYGDEGYADVSLLDIKREVEKSIKDASYKNPYDNKLVRFTGVVSTYKDGTLYVQEFYPIDDDHPNEGEWAGINIFCGMSEISPKFTTPNTYIQVYGLCKDSETFGFQITDTQGKWKVYGATDEDCKILLKASENTDEHSLYTFHYTVAELNKVVEDINCESLFCAVSVEGELTCSGAFVSDSRDITVSFAEAKFKVYIPFAYHGDQTDASTQVIRWDTEAQFKGKKFRIDSGTYAWHRTTSGKVNFQIIPTDELTFVWVQE